jgi:hypothetical protein
MKGFYQLADLSVQVTGDKKELILAQHVEREFDRACRRLRDASGADQVYLRIDTDLETDDGRTFDKVRLRAYASNSPELYTIDVGTTEKNPFNMYVPWNASIRIYNRETEAVRELDPETGEITERQNGSQQQSSPDESSSGANPSGDDRASSTPENGHESEKLYDQSGGRELSPEDAARSLVQKAKDHESGQLAGEVAVDGDPLSQKLRGLADYAGRDRGYRMRVLDALSVSGFDEIAVGQVQDTAYMILDEDTLKENEEFEPDDALPF